MVLSTGDQCEVPYIQERGGPRGGAREGHQEWSPANTTSEGKMSVLFQVKKKKK